MHYIQNYVEKLRETKNNVSKSNNVLLYCNYYSFYSQKVLMALYEKEVQFQPFVIDITKGEQYSPWFMQINPRGEIPVLKLNNEIIWDSSRILDYLDKYFPDSKPIVHVSTDEKVLDKINKYRELLESLPAGVITVGSFFNPHLCGTPRLPFLLPVREMLKNADYNSAENLRKLAAEYPDLQHILLYKADIQDRKHEIHTSEEEYLKMLLIVGQVLDEVENELKNQSEGNWLCCETFTIADIDLAVLLQRIWELGLEKRFWANGKRPFVENYFHRISQRDSFKKTVPHIPDHIKMLITTQPPAYVATAGVVTLGVVMTILFGLKSLFR